MCGRYRFDEGEPTGLRAIIEEVNRRAPDTPVKTSGEVFPTDVVPVVASDRRLSPAAFPMAWGYTLPDGRRVINARSETAGERPLFRDGMERRRCAVPATSYFEWQRTGPRTKYAIRPADGEWFCLAGLYRLEAGRPVFTILTRAPGDRVAFIHDRMPVILPPDLARDWLNPAHAAADLLRHAVLDVVPTPADGTEQLRMEF